MRREIATQPTEVIDGDLLLRAMVKETTLQVSALQSVIEAAVCAGLVGSKADALDEIDAAVGHLERACQMVGVGEDELYEEGERR